MYMFQGCHLHYDSAVNILDSIPNVTNESSSDKTITVGMLGALSSTICDVNCCLEPADDGSGYTFKRRAGVVAAIKKAKNEKGWTNFAE